MIWNEEMEDISKIVKSLEDSWSLHSTNSALAVAVKKNAKVDIKLFFSCPILLDFSILFQIFCPGL